MNDNHEIEISIALVKAEDLPKTPKTVCEEHTNHRLTVQGASYNSSYVCENSDCIMWGKSQPVKISCNVSGEWVDVYD